jgi:hypothetical protein
MMKRLFVNLPVQDLDRSVSFFGALGFQLVPEYTDENAACIEINEGAYAMLLTRDFMARFTTRKICQPGECRELLLAVTCESREEVDELFERALASGATAEGPIRDEGWMYERYFADPDGHVWDLFWMTDPAADGK